MNYLIINLCFFLTASLIAPSHAQSEKKKNGRPVTISVMDRRSDFPEEIRVITATETETVKLWRTRPSETLMIPRTETTLLFCPPELDLSTVENIAELGLPAVTIPSNIDKIILLAQSDNSNKYLPLKFRSVDASDDVFGGGDLMFINHSSKKLAGIVDTQKITLRPNESKVLQLKKNRADNHYTAQFFSQSTAPRKETKKLFNKLWLYSQRKRLIILFYEEKEAKRITYDSLVLRMN